MPPYKATHIPYGLTDHSKRTIVNPGIKDEAEFLQYGIETGGEHFYVRTSVQGGGGVPLHRHATYGETFIPVQGPIGVVGLDGTETLTLTPESKDTYTVKPGEWHRFFNPSPTEALVFDAKVVPAHQGFEKLLHIFYGLVADGYGTPEGFPRSWFYQLMLMSMGQVSYPGLFGWTIGLLASGVGLLARLTGEEERLTRKYFGRPITEEERVKWKVN